MRTLLKNISTSNRQRGFTLVELLVAISIMTVISMSLMFNYNVMNSRLTVDNLAHQTAQWVRATQVSAMSVRHTTDNSKYPGYGLHFERATPSQFVFFADLDGDKHYAQLTGVQKCGDSGVECQKTITLLHGNTITALCGESGGVPAASDCSPLTYLASLDIIFTRPDPDAIIYGDDTSGVQTLYSTVNITLSSIKGYSRTVGVWTTGQVSVQ